MVGLEVLINLGEGSEIQVNVLITNFAFLI